MLSAKLKADVALRLNGVCFTLGARARHSAPDDVLVCLAGMLQHGR
jgi:hypothetical protein